MPVELDFPTTTVVGTQYQNWVWNGTAWDFAQTLPGGLPAGSIIQWAGATAPANWLICDGAAVSRATYASLFAAIGTTYGTGDGLTTFNLPDLRGRVPVGKNGGTFGTLAGTGGAETHTLTEAQIPSHTHAIGFTDSFIGGWQYTSNNGPYDPGPSGGYGNIGWTGGGQAHNNLQPYLVVNYIIKTTAAATPGDSELATRVGTLEQNPNITGTLTVAGNTTLNGRLKLANQPSFKAYASGGSQINNPANPTNLVFGDTTGFGGHNIGGHYNTSTGVFTAPVAGRYLFTMNMLTNPANSTNDPGYVLVGIYINGTFAHYMAHNHNQAWVMEGSAIVLSLAANDYVNLVLQYGSGHYGQWSYFSGALLG